MDGGRVSKYSCLRASLASMRSLGISLRIWAARSPVLVQGRSLEKGEREKRGRETERERAREGGGRESERRGREREQNKKKVV